MRFFTQEHLWLDYEDGIVILGLTAYAASRFREDAVLKFPAESRLLSPGMPIASLESPGLLHDIRSPLAGFQLGVNRDLQRSPHKDICRDAATRLFWKTCPLNGSLRPSIPE